MTIFVINCDAYKAFIFMLKVSSYPIIAIQAGQGGSLDFFPGENVEANN